MRDIIAINKRIFEHERGEISEQQIRYLELVPICIATLTPDEKDIRAFFEGGQSKENVLNVTAINLDYLNEARMAAKDAVAGISARLLEFGLSIPQAAALAKLSTTEVRRLAHYWPGRIFTVNYQAIDAGMTMPTSALRHHASALITTL